MANSEHLEILKQGVEKWNDWRKANHHIEPDLSYSDLNYSNLKKANLASTNLSHANLRNANLAYSNLEFSNLESAKLSNAILGYANFNKCIAKNAYFDDADFYYASFIEADLTNAVFWNARMWSVNMRGAILVNANLAYTDFRDQGDRDGNESSDLRNANLSGASLTNANLSNVLFNNSNLTGANLHKSNLVESDFSGAIITDAKIYGISAWNLKLENTIQKNLVISKWDEPLMSVDNLVVAQFIYLIINNKNIRDIMNTITSKGVLILGRFADPQRKAVLDGLREKLRNFNLLPIVFDFDRPIDKDYTETIQTLAGMSMFVIADLTNPKSSPLELESTIKQFKIPYVPIIDISIDPHPFSMLVDLQKSFHWVLPTVGYKSKEQLLKDDVLNKYIIDPVNKKRAELRTDKSLEQKFTVITEIVDGAS